MKKKLITGLLVAFCFVASSFLSTALVKADVIWEPRNDNFYNEHIRECKYLSRSFTVRSDRGYTIAYVSPLSSVELREIKNGEKVHIMYTYIDRNKKEWGMLIENPNDPVNYNETSWIRMDDVALNYDHLEFCNDHRAELAPMDERFKNVNEQVDVVLWSYPNSGVVTYSISNYRMGTNMGYLYTDPYGRTWAYMYYYESKKGWICLDAPNSTNLSKVTPRPSATIEPTSSPEPSATIEPTSSPEPSIIPTVSPAVKNALTCGFETVNTWPGGFIGQITITNNTSMPIKNWEATFKTEYTITSLWGANLVSSEDGKFTVTNDTWDEAIQPLQSKNFNFVVQNDYKEPIADIAARSVR